MVRDRITSKGAGIEARHGTPRGPYHYTSVTNLGILGWERTNIDIIWKATFMCVPLQVLMPLPKVLEGCFPSTSCPQTRAVMARPRRSGRCWKRRQG